MTTNTDDLSTINNAVLARKLTSTITHFQAVDGSGWVPQEGANNDPVNDGSIADLLQTVVDSGDNDTVAAKLRALVQALKRVPSQDVPKATVNREGSTQSPVTVVGGDKGQRATWVNGTSFSTGGGVLNVSDPELLEFARKDVNEATSNRVSKSHKQEFGKVHLKNETHYNVDRTNMDRVGEIHAESIAASPEEYRANKARQIELDAQLSRLKSGKGTLEDLRSKFNSLQS